MNTCPACGTDDYYYGLNGHSCVNSGCEHFSRLSSVRRDPPEPKLEEDFRKLFTLMHGNHFLCLEWPRGTEFRIWAGPTAGSKPEGLLSDVTQYTHFETSYVRGSYLTQSWGWNGFRVEDDGNGVYGSHDMLIPFEFVRYIINILSDELGEPKIIEGKRPQ